MRTLFAEFSENKLRADEGIAQQTVDGITGFLKCNAAGLDSKHKNSEDELQAQPPRHGLQSNGAPVRREGISQHQHGQQAENSSEASHSVFLPRFSDHAMNQRPFLTQG